MTWTANVLVWGKPYRPWWTYLGRERKWRYALALAIASLTGCSTCRPSRDMTQAQCDQYQADLEKAKAMPATTASPYDYGAGKLPTWRVNQ